MKAFDKFMDAMGFTEVKEEEEFMEENAQFEELDERKPRKNKARLVPFSGGAPSKEQIKVVLLEPMAFDDCQQIADSLKHRRTVIINLENLDLITARRIIDFVGGTVYALGGALQKIGAGIIIAVPSNVDISGDLAGMTQPKEVFAWITRINEAQEMRKY